MQLSELQKYILKQTYRGGPRTARSIFVKFYPKASDEEQNTITRSIERLVIKGLLISYGRKTAQKWFTDTVSLTPAGRKRALSLYSEQARLPLQLPKAKKRA
jgi:DNA-binding MarR family transcriptional regulator